MINTRDLYNFNFDVSKHNIFEVNANNFITNYKLTELDQLIDQTISKVLKDIETLMIKKKINKSKLAKLMGCSRANVTSLFKSKNITIANLIRLIKLIDPDYTLDIKVSIDLTKVNPDLYLLAC